MGISPYPLHNRRFTCLLVSPKGVHSTISNIGRDSRYWNTWTPSGRNSSNGRRSMRTKNKDKELNHRHFVAVRLTDVELNLLDQGAACFSISRSEYLRKLLLEKQINHRSYCSGWKKNHSERVYGTEIRPAKTGWDQSENYRSWSQTNIHCIPNTERIFAKCDWWMRCHIQ